MMKITAENIQGWACDGAVAYLATTYPDGVDVDEAFLRRWAAGEEWMEANWTDLARAAVQVDPSIVFDFTNMAFEYAARLNPSLTPFVGTVKDEATARAAARAAARASCAARASRATRAAARAAVWAAEAAAWATRGAARAAAGAEAGAAWAARSAAEVATEVAAQGAETARSAVWAEEAGAAAEVARERIIALCIAAILN